MKQELQEQLFNKYPHLFSEKGLPMQQTCMCWGIECDDGWYDLIDELCSKIVKLGKSLTASQVKEKWGGLRFYTSSGSEEVWNLIHEYEEKSYTICEICGKKGKLRKDLNWIKTLCNIHYKKSKIHASQPVKPKTNSRSLG